MGPSSSILSGSCSEASIKSTGAGGKLQVGCVGGRGDEEGGGGGAAGDWTRGMGLE